VANVVFTTKPSPSYDDAPEERYHFPRRYLRRAQEAIGDWIVYYEPRRANSTESNRDGRQVYFAMARVARIEPDPLLPDHYYAIIAGASYLEFPQPVSFRQNGRLLESTARNPDGSVNPGVFINAIRALTRADFDLICRLGLAPAWADVGVGDTLVGEDLAVAETQAEYGGPRLFGSYSRPLRDAAFGRVVRNAYDRTCAMTGLKLINGGGRCEIEPAHIKPVEDDGPDSPRNGIALSRTVHWLFDRGFLSVADDGEILITRQKVPDGVLRLLNPERRILLPSSASMRPHRAFLRFHRETKFKG
jgi:putative restriction endonuclease